MGVEPSPLVEWSAFGIFWGGPKDTRSAEASRTKPKGVLPIKNKVKSWGKHINQSYTVVINGIEGTANISSKLGRTLFVSIGDYYLHFDVK